VTIRWFAAATFGFAVALTGHAQQSFETISLKMSAAGKKEFFSTARKKLTVRGASLESFIRVAYHVRDFQNSGEPAWLNSECYDLDAVAKCCWRCTSTWRTTAGGNSSAR